jgi:hypothetical protein
VSRSTNRLTWITDIEFLLLVEKTGNWSVASCRFETSLRVFLFLLMTYAPLANFVERRDPHLLKQSVSARDQI